LKEFDEICRNLEDEGIIRNLKELEGIVRKLKTLKNLKVLKIFKFSGFFKNFQGMFEKIKNLNEF
jgi:3-methyladenine DNA glycosylase Tag